MNNIRHHRLVFICSIAFLASLVGFVFWGLAFAAPSICNFPGTTARAVKVYGASSLPAACAMNVCRTVGKKTTKVVPCGDADPNCVGTPFYMEQWKAEAGAWGGLSACPSWTNTSVWE